MSKINFAFLSTNLVCTKQVGKGGVLVGCSAANYESLGWQVDVFFKFNCIFIWHQPTLTPTIEELHVLEYRTYNNVEKTPVILYQEALGNSGKKKNQWQIQAHRGQPSAITSWGGGEMRRESKQAERTETTNSITKKKPQKLGVTVLNLQMRYSRTGDTCRKVQRNMSENIAKTKQETQK